MKKPASVPRKLLAKARQRSVLEHDFPELVTTAGLRRNQGEPAADLSLARTGSRGVHGECTAGLCSLPGYSARKTGVCSWIVSSSWTLRSRWSGSAALARGARIVLLMASDDDPLFLQIKEARPSVLEALCGQKPARQPRPARRAWLSADAIRERSLPRLDGKQTRPSVLRSATQGHEDQDAGRGFHAGCHASVCRSCAAGRLAHAHARSGEPAKISRLPRERAIPSTRPLRTSLSPTPIKANSDHETLLKAVSAGKLEVFIERE